MEDKRVHIRKEAVKNWLKDPLNLSLAVLAIVVVITRLYYFFLVGSQPIWWDEGDYLAVAKIWATGSPLPEWWSHFTGMRPLLLPLIWAFLFKLSSGEFLLRFFTILLPSLGTIFVCYLLGKDLYNKAVGVISAIFMASYWVFTFYSFRLLTDVPAVFLGLLSVYFFWSHYILKDKPSGLYLAMLFGVLAFSTRFPLALVPISLTLFVLFVKKLNAFKDKTLWKGFAWTIIFLLPYTIYFILNKFAALRFYFGSSAVSIYEPIAWYAAKMLFTLPHIFMVVAFIIGILSLYPLIMYFDLIWKQKTKEFNADLLITIFLITHLVFYVVILRGATDRWLLMLMPLIFILSAKGLMKVYEFVKKYNAAVAVAFLTIMVIGGAYQNSVHAHNLIMEKKDTYLEIKLAGEWLKENTPQDARIVTSSIVQNEYYSGRSSYDFHGNLSELPEGCMDKLGNTIDSELCQTASENLFQQKKEKINPDYMIVSVFEPVFTPKWAYTYPERHNMTIVKAFAFMQQPNQPALIIYKF